MSPDSPRFIIGQTVLVVLWIAVAAPLILLAQTLQAAPRTRPRRATLHAAGPEHPADRGDRPADHGAARGYLPHAEDLGLGSHCRFVRLRRPTTVVVGRIVSGPLGVIEKRVGSHHQPVGGLGPVPRGQTD